MKMQNVNTPLFRNIYNRQNSMHIEMQKKK